MVLWWICHRMGSLMNSSWVITPITLGNYFYMHISASIIEKSILFNIVESMHDTVTQIVSIPVFSGLVIRINTIWNH